MDIKQIRYFVAVAEELHFGRAAIRVHISQPPLSQQIRALEEELGVRLLERTSRSVRLTEAGRVFLAEARAILERLDAAGEAARGAARGEAGRVAVGFVGPAMDSPLPWAIRAFRERLPGVELALHELPTTVQLEMLRAGRLDIGFLRLFRHDLRGLSAEPFWREPYVLALPEGHPLAAKDRIALEDLRGEPLILYPRRTQPDLFDAVTAALHVQGPHVGGVAEDEAGPVRVVQEVVTKRATVALVAAGLGLALVPASMAQSGPRGVAFRPMLDRGGQGETVLLGLPEVEIAMVRSGNDSSPAADRFLETAREFAGRGEAQGSASSAGPVRTEGRPR